MSDAPKVTIAEMLRATAFLIEHPERWEEFKGQFAHATCVAVVRIAESRGVPPDVVAKLKKQLGVDGEG